MLQTMTYPGGKNGAGVYQTIISRIPPHRVYIEPFLGGGAIMRLKRPAEINIGLDLDPLIIGQWECHQRESPTTMEACIIEFGDRRDREDVDFRKFAKGVRSDEFGRARQRRRAEIASSAKARRTGATRQIRRVDPEFRFDVRNAIDFLVTWDFKGDEFVYCDPPYLHSTRGRADLYRHEMTDIEHIRLLGILRGLAAKGVKVMISGYFSKLYQQMLKDWHTFTYTAVTRSGATAEEWLWTNFEEPIALHDYRYLGTNFRERERIKRKKARWVSRLRGMPVLERRSLLAAIGEAWDSSH